MFFTVRGLKQTTACVVVVALSVSMEGCEKDEVSELSPVVRCSRLISPVPPATNGVARRLAMRDGASCAAERKAVLMQPDMATLTAVRECLLSARACEYESDALEMMRNGAAAVGDLELLSCLAVIVCEEDAPCRACALLLIGERFGLRQVDVVSSSLAVRLFAMDKARPDAVADLPSSDEEDDADEKAEALQVQGVVEVVSAGLKDPDAAVRKAAYDTMRVLGVEESGVIAMRLMRGSDQSLKKDLLGEVAGSALDTDVRYSLMALEGPDQELRRMATENLRQLTGQTFDSVESALDWRERHESWANQDGSSPP